MILELVKIYFLGRIYPGIYINGIYIGGKTTAKAQDLVLKNVATPSPITLIADSQVFTISLKDLNFNYKIEDTIKNAYQTGRFLIPLKKIDLPLLYSLDRDKLNNQIQIIAGQAETPPVNPSVKNGPGQQILVDKGSPGYIIDSEKIKTDINEELARQNYKPLYLQKIVTDPSLNDLQTQEYRARATKLLGKNIIIQFEDREFNLTDSDLIEIIDPKGTYDAKKISPEVAKISKNINRDPVNPVLVFDGTKVNEFTPAKPGVTVLADEFQKNIADALSMLENGEDKNTVIKVPVTTTEAGIKTADINNLGIKELIGRGTSKFKGSIPGRIHNIALAAGKLNGTLIKPGETFSFNDALGDVSKYTGYQSAYIIKDGKTVLGDGGGVCQVSTTIFRAALNAGLPISERHAHAYRVYYYEEDSPPGLDATVYSPTTDLKFVNDTPGHILIQATADTKNLNLTFELYGTKDGRISEVTKPVIVSSTAPSDDLYIDDPTLPAGTVKQTEHKAWGAKVIFNYLVTKADGSITKKTFTSNYQPWQAVYLRGTSPI